LENSYLNIPQTAITAFRITVQRPLRSAPGFLHPEALRAGTDKEESLVGPEKYPICGTEHAKRASVEAAYILEIHNHII